MTSRLNITSYNSLHGCALSLLPDTHRKRNMLSDFLLVYCPQIPLSQSAGDYLDENSKVLSNTAFDLNPVFIRVEPSEVLLRLRLTSTEKV